VRLHLPRPRPPALRLHARRRHRLPAPPRLQPSFAPFFHPDGKRIIFSSNHGDPRGREFDLYIVRDDGTGLERITASPEFDGFPMFSPDGRELVFASNRHSATRGDTNIFIADWVETADTPSAGGR
jgi:Tol biopolymer transport system component